MQTKNGFRTADGKIHTDEAEKVKVFITEDGKKFTVESEAIKHEAEVKFCTDIRVQFSTTFKVAPDCDRMLSLMLANPEKFRDWLNTFIRANARAEKLEQKHELVELSKAA
jgi:hypothetical protein